MATAADHDWAMSGAVVAGTGTMSVEDYLETTDWEPDLEYVDGELRARALVKPIHGTLQVLIGAWFVSHVDEWRVMASVEVRMRVSFKRVRLPDVMVNPIGPLPENVVERPPLIVIEVLSPTDSVGRTVERVHDYVAMGIPNIWLLDPETRTAHVCTSQGWTEVRRFEVENSPIYMDVDALFAQFDECATA